MAVYPLHLAYLSLAEECLRVTLDTYGGSQAAFREACGGPVVESTQKVEESMSEYLGELGWGDRCRVNFREDGVEALCWEGKAPDENYVHVGLPLRMRSKWMQGAIHHEIGTHMVRYVNGQKQTWSGLADPSKLTQFGVGCTFNPALTATEEGLAVINALWGSEDKAQLYYSALHYFAVARAHTEDFYTLYHTLEPYVTDPLRRWAQCVRVRKGLRDQSGFGAFCRDQVYWVGCVEVLRNRHRCNFSALHSAKVAMHELAVVRRHLKTKDAVLPPFLKNLAEYVAHLDDVVAQNPYLVEKEKELGAKAEAVAQAEEVANAAADGGRGAID
jgi:hypothetical protein